MNEGRRKENRSKRSKRERGREREGEGEEVKPQLDDDEDDQGSQSSVGQLHSSSISRVGVGTVTFHSHFRNHFHRNYYILSLNLPNELLILTSYSQFIPQWSLSYRSILRVLPLPPIDQLVLVFDH